MSRVVSSRIPTIIIEFKQMTIGRSLTAWQQKPFCFQAHLPGRRSLPGKKYLLGHLQASRAQQLSNNLQTDMAAARHFSALSKPDNYDDSTI